MMSSELTLLEALFEHPRDYIVLVRDGKILRANTVLAALLGQSPAMLEGQPFSSFVAPPDLGGAEALLEHHHAVPESGSRTVRLVAADSSWRSVCWTVRLVSAAEQPATLAIGCDLTDRLGLDREPRGSTRAPTDSPATPGSRLKALDGLKADLMSTISHELRTPLVSIRGYADLLAEGHLGSLTERQQQAVEVMLRNVDRLMQIIDNILTYAALEHGQVALEPQSVTLNTALASAVRLNEPFAEQRQVRVDLDLPEEALTIEADPHHLGTLFHQLISNAIKFNKAGGLVTVEARRADGGVEISVTDTGVGIPLERLSQIFERFYQVDGSRTRRYSGLGLGLALVRGIVALHQGTIRVESQQDEGSRFVVWLPARAEAVPAS